MNRNHFSPLMPVAAIALMASCASSQDEMQTAETGTSVVTAKVQNFQEEGQQTRTSIEVSASDQISYKWAVGDVLGIFPDAGTQVAFELSESSLSADGLSATFDGGAWALKAGHSYYSYFPFSYTCFDQTIDKTNIPMSYLGQKQLKFSDTTNAGQYDFNAAGASSSSSGNLSFEFKHLGALLRIKLAIPATATYKTLTLTSDAAVIPVKGYVDLTASTLIYTPTEYASTLTIDLNNTSATQGETAYVYLMLPPMTLNTQGRSLTATLAYDSKSTIYNLCSEGSTTTNIPDFKAGTRYKREAVYASGDPVGKMDEGEDEETTSNLLPGKFSVSATKQVQFTKSNLYWDGSAYHFEANQTDYPTSWNASHVSHFFWTNLTDYQSGNASYMPYAESYSYSSQSTSDKFWCGEDNPMTVEGISGLYALTGGSSGEWYYLINSRTNASTLYKYGVTVTNGGTSYSNCLIIAPDDFSGTLASSYTLDEVNNLGLVCLPAAGYRSGSSFRNGGSYGYYWSATPYSSNSNYACSLYFNSSYIGPAYYGNRSHGQGLRLVRGI